MRADDYYYDYGWLWEDNKDKAYRSVSADLHYRVIKYYKDGRMDNMTDPIPRDDAVEKLKQIKLLDPIGQQDWVDDWKERKQEMYETGNDYLRAKGRL
jgi:hypothetical protein